MHAVPVMALTKSAPVATRQAPEALMAFCSSPATTLFTRVAACLPLTPSGKGTVLLASAPVSTWFTAPLITSVDTREQRGSDRGIRKACGKAI